MRGNKVEKKDKDFMEDFTDRVSDLLKMISGVLKQDYKIKKLQLYREIGIPTSDDNYDGYTDLIPLTCPEEFQPNTLLYLDAVMEVGNNDFHVHMMFHFDKDMEIVTENLQIDELALVKEMPKNEIKKKILELAKRLGNYLTIIIIYVIKDWIKGKILK